MTGCRNCEQRTDGDCGAHGPASEPMYPCADCGALRTKDQGGTVFTVCDACWEKRNPPAGTAAPFVAEIRAPLEAEVARLQERAEAAERERDRLHGVYDRSQQAQGLDRAEAEIARLTAELAAAEARVAYNLQLRAEAENERDSVRGILHAYASGELEGHSPRCARQLLPDGTRRRVCGVDCAVARAERAEAELAAEREKRAESEAREGRLRALAQNCVADFPCANKKRSNTVLCRCDCDSDLAPDQWCSFCRLRYALVGGVTA